MCHPRPESNRQCEILWGKLCHRDWQYSPGWLPISLGTREGMTQLGPRGLGWRGAVSEHSLTCSDRWSCQSSLIVSNRSQFWLIRAKRHLLDSGGSSQTWRKKGLGLGRRDSTRTLSYSRADISTTQLQPFPLLCYPPKSQILGREGWITFVWVICPSLGASPKGTHLPM